MVKVYKAGQEVFAIKNPSDKLIIRRRWDNLYYCRNKKDPSLKELIYFERELSSDAASGE